MRGATKMLMARSRPGADDMRSEHDRTRNEMYRPRNDSKGSLTWDNTRRTESTYWPDYEPHRYYEPRDDMNEPESRQRRDSRGRFRSEVSNYYPSPDYPPPVYENFEEKRQIGFSAYDGEQRDGLQVIRGGAAAENMKLDEDTAHRWMQGLKNEDGTKGPHWTIEQTNQAMKQKGINCDPLEFWVAMNAVYSDYVGVAKKMNVNNVDFYVAMAKAFLNDKDSQPNRLARYYHYVTKH